MNMYIRHSSNQSTTELKEYGALGKIWKSSDSEPLSKFKMAKTIAILNLLGNREYFALAIRLIKMPSEAEYYAALLGGKNFRFSFGARMALFDSIERALILAYKEGADLSGIMPALKAISLEESPGKYASSYAAYRILCNLRNTKFEGRPSQKEISGMVEELKARLDCVF